MSAKTPPSSAIQPFTGIPADAIAFYEELETDNSKSFWEQNKQRYKTSVRHPMEALAASLGDVGDFHLYRPHNDLRFHKNKPPYKTHQGAYTESDGGAGYYIQLSENGLMVAYGYYMMAKDQLTRFRAAVADDTTGPQVQALVDGLPSTVTVGAIGELKTAPRGYPKDHPRIVLLRRKGLMVMREFGAPKWLHTKAVTAKVRDFWDSGDDICAWLDTNVGPSEEPPDDIF